MPKIYITKVEIKNKWNNKLLLCKHSLKMPIYIKEYTYNPD